MLSTLLSIVIGLVLYAVVIYIVSRLGMGLTVANFTSALIAGAVIAIVSWLVWWLLGLLGIGNGSGLIAAIVNLVVAAVILLIADRFVPGMKVNGFVGALIAAVAIAVVAWLIGWLLGALGIGVDANPTTLLLRSLF
jgi:putative membrane protein